MNTSLFVKENTIGSIAMQWIQTQSNVLILGHTSGGIFLQLAERQKVIYLTNYPDFGPINLNLTTQLPEQWDKGKPISILKKNGTLVFHHGAKKIYVLDYSLWNSDISTTYDIDQATLTERIKKTVSQLSLLKGNHGFAALFPYLVNHNNKPVESSLARVWENIQVLKQACLDLNLSNFLSAARPIISYGRGLTPSGDDFLVGLIYCLYRKKDHQQYQNFLEGMKNPLLAAASERTTSISVSLLTCAFMGQAHSRTQAMTEALTSHKVAFENQALKMAGWGSSSGADTTLGIIIASQILQSLKENP